MDAKFTKGPWRRASNAAGDEYTLSIVDARGRPIARAIQYSCGLEDADEAEVNAALIAAAPDLYDALREWGRLCLVIESAVRTADPAYTSAVVDALKRARAALAKATP